MPTPGNQTPAPSSPETRNSKPETFTPALEASAEVLAHWQKLEGQVRRMQQIVREYAGQLAGYEQHRQSQIEQARQDIRAEITTELSSLRGELEAERKQLEERQTQLDAADKQLAADRKRIEEDRAKLTGESKELAEHRQALDGLTEQLDKREQELAGQRKQLDAMAGDLGKQRGELESHRAQLDEAHARRAAELEADYKKRLAGLELDHQKQADALESRYAERLKEVEAKQAELEAEHRRRQKEIDDAAAMLADRHVALDGELEQELAQHEQQLKAMRDGNGVTRLSAPGSVLVPGSSGVDTSAMERKIRELEQQLQLKHDDSQQQEKSLLQRIDDLAKRLKTAEQKPPAPAASHTDDDKKAAELLGKLERREQRIRQVEKEMSKRRARLRLYKDILDARSQRMQRGKSEDTLVGEEALGELDADPTEALLPAETESQARPVSASPAPVPPPTHPPERHADKHDKAKRKGGVLSWLKSKPGDDKSHAPGSNTHAPGAAARDHRDDGNDMPEFKPL
ncbi:MAG: hypothetical protein WC058_14575 [Phycisphaeraceae bacterium]